MRTRTNRGFTLIETAAVLAAAAGVSTVVLVGQPPEEIAKARASARQLKDATHVRAIGQACVIWAQQNKDQYPIPSLLDKSNLTLKADKPEQQVQKDTTGNILSILIWNGAISPEICVSPSEVNPKIKVDAGYDNNLPKAAGKNAQTSLWDPGFRGTPDDDVIARGTPGEDTTLGHNSYAHTPGFSQRFAIWANTFQATEAAWGSRGPAYQGTTYPSAGWKLAAGKTGTESNTLKFFGDGKSWRGNIGYNDNHVSFETRPDPIENVYRRNVEQDPKVVPDNLFVNETDDATRSKDAAADAPVGANNWLRPIAKVTGTRTWEEKKVKASDGEEHIIQVNVDKVTLKTFID